MSTTELLILVIIITANGHFKVIHTIVCSVEIAIVIGTRKHFEVIIMCNFLS